MRTKKVCALLAILLLAACTPKTNETPTAPTTEPGQVPTSVVTEPPAVSAPPFSEIARQELIDRRYTIEGYSFTDTQIWAELLVSEQYRAYGLYELSSHFAGGYEIDFFFADAREVRVTAWGVSFRAESPVPGLDGENGLYTQVVTLVSVGEGGRISLSGCLIGEYADMRAEDVFAYLMLDARYSAQLRFPSPDYTAGLREYNLTALLGVTQTYTTYALDERSIGVVTVADWESAPPRLEMTLFDLESGAALARGDALGYPYQMRRTADAIECEIMEPDSTDIRVVSLFRNGDVLTRTETEAQRQTHPMPGGLSIVQENASLYSVNGRGEKTLLLEGNPSDDIDVRSYYFFEAIDEYRFVYGIGGWEFSLGCGIYDLRDGSDHPIEPPSQDGRPMPWRLIGDRLFTHVGGMGPAFDGAVTDVNTYQTHMLNADILQAFTGHTTSFDLSPDGTRLAMLERTADDQAVLRVFSVLTGELLARETVVNPLTSVQYVQFASNTRLFLRGERRAGCDVYLYSADVR